MVLQIAIRDIAGAAARVGVRREHREHATGMRLSTVSLLALVILVLGGCSTSRQVDPHIVKLDLPYSETIADPYEWALIQFSDGPVSGPEVSDYARRVLEYGLCQAFSEAGPDGTRDLFIRQDCPARCWGVLVFTPVKGGYRYLGNFTASVMAVSLTDRPHSVLVYVPCGGHQGSIDVYEYDGDAVRCMSSEWITGGDGAPEENNRKLAALFPQERRLKWAKVPDRWMRRTRDRPLLSLSLRR
jgi:hypothetical protein